MELAGFSRTSFRYHHNLFVVGPSLVHGEVKSLSCYSFSGLFVLLLNQLEACLCVVRVFELMQYRNHVFHFGSKLFSLVKRL